MGVDRDGVAEAFRRFEATRKPRTSRVQLNSRTNTGHPSSKFQRRRRVYRGTLKQRSAESRRQAAWREPSLLTR
jgi:hypothetical protein